MKMIFKYPLMIIAAAILQQCSYSQNKSNSNTSTMDSTKKNNPVYSNTDTSKVAMSDEEWKKW